MTPHEIKIKQEQEFLDRCNHAYWIENKPIISDLEYDQRMKALRDAGGMTDQLEAIAGGYGAGDPQNDKKVKHLYPMNTIPSVTTQEELLQAIPQHTSEVIIQPKVDGFAIAVQLKKDKVVNVSTRGDGIIGTNITKTAKKIPTFPKEIGVANYWKEVYGEIYISNQNFKKVKNTYPTQRAAAWALFQKGETGLLDVVFYSGHNRWGMFGVKHGVEKNPSYDFGTNQIVTLPIPPSLNPACLISLAIKDIDISYMPIDGYVIRYGDRELTTIAYKPTHNAQ